ncbi:hypothetical protein PTI98_009856 [Pleurotus ostreatus]|nr:hypothetical protein PTI98_009856 [Pleurotus ostreatus]
MYFGHCNIRQNWQLRLSPPIVLSGSRWVYIISARASRECRIQLLDIESKFISSSLSSMAAYLPSYGRPQGAYAPSGDWTVKDPAQALQVFLMVDPAARRSRTGAANTPKDSHWMLAWHVGTTLSGHEAHRRCHLRQDPGVPHLTNWGVLTGAVESHELQRLVRVPLAILEKDARLKLEAIANTTQVRVPDGRWNCQDWCIEVLNQAAMARIFSPAAVQTAIARAQQVPLHD